MPLAFVSGWVGGLGIGNTGGEDEKLVVVGIGGEALSDESVTDDHGGGLGLKIGDLGEWDSVNLFVHKSSHSTPFPTMSRPTRGNDLNDFSGRTRRSSSFLSRGDCFGMPVDSFIGSVIGIPRNRRGCGGEVWRYSSR